MASLHYCAPAYHPITALCRPSAETSRPSLSFNSRTCDNLQTQFHFRLKKEVRAVANQRLNLVFASNRNPSEVSDVKSSDSTDQGPPFLTILAGFVVFLGICWIIGSVVMWLVGLIVHPPPLK